MSNTKPHNPGYGQPPGSWITAAQGHPGTRLRLFCLPYAGGGSGMFHAWSRGLPPEIQVCPIRLPGREDRLREQPFTRVAPLVDELARAIEPYLDRPFAIFGHSMGAWIGFELASLLDRRGLSPVYLVVSGMPAPQLRPRDARAHELPDAEFVARLHELQGTPVEVLSNPELLALVLPLLRADFELVETYRYTQDKPLTCPILAFGGLSDPEVSHEELLAWCEQTQAVFELCMLPGGHFFVNESHAALLRVLAGALQLRLHQGA